MHASRNLGIELKQFQQRARIWQLPAPVIMPIWHHIRDKAPKPVAPNRSSGVHKHQYNLAVHAK